MVSDTGKKARYEKSLVSNRKSLLFIVHCACFFKTLHSFAFVWQTDISRKEQASMNFHYVTVYKSNPCLKLLLDAG